MRSTRAGVSAAGDPVRRRALTEPHDRLWRRRSVQRRQAAQPGRIPADRRRRRAGRVVGNDLLMQARAWDPGQAYARSACRRVANGHWRGCHASRMRRNAIPLPMPVTPNASPSWSGNWPSGTCTPTAPPLQRLEGGSDQNRWPSGRAQVQAGPVPAGDHGLLATVLRARPASPTHHRARIAWNFCTGDYRPHQQSEVDRVAEDVMAESRPDAPPVEGRTRARPPGRLARAEAIASFSFGFGMWPLGARRSPGLLRLPRLDIAHRQGRITPADPACLDIVAPKRPRLAEASDALAAGLVAERRLVAIAVSGVASSRRHSLNAA